MSPLYLGLMNPEYYFPNLNTALRVGEKAGVYMYPHRLRSERACHLASSLKVESLLEWFSWEDWETAKRYAKKGAMGLAKELGVELPKTVN